MVQSVYDGDGDVSAMVSEMIACTLMTPLRRLFRSLARLNVTR